MQYKEGDVIYPGGPGGAGGGCTIQNTDPTPNAHGGLPAGSVIAGQDACQVLEQILFPYQYPAFSAFYINGQATSLEAGDTITGGIRDFRWSTTHNVNIVANTIEITDTTAGGTVLGTGLSNDSQENLNIGPDITRNGGSYTWHITGQNGKGGTFGRNFTVYWRNRVYWGPNANAVLTEAEIKSLSDSALKTGYAGNYNFVNPGNAEYYYVVYPSSMGSFSTWIDSNTNFAVDYTDVGTVNVTNAFGVTTPMRVFRTTYQQNGNVDTTMA